MVEDAVDDVGDGLEAAVRVPGRALGLAGRVLDGAHLVHVDERVEVAQVDAGEGALDREPLALEPAGRVGHGADAALLGGRGGRHARQDGEVGDGDSRHGHSRSSSIFNYLVGTTPS